MKKVIGYVLLVVIVAATVTGCKKVINSAFPGVDVDVPQVSFTVPAPPYPIPPGTPVPANETSIGSFTQPFNLDSVVKAKTSGEFGAGDVGSVKIKQIVFNMANTDDQNNFSNFESARLTMTSDAASNNQELEIASFTFPTDNISTFTYTAPANTPDLRPYLNGTTITYKVYGKLRRYTSKELPISVRVTMTVK